MLHLLALALLLTANQLQPAAALAIPNELDNEAQVTNEQIRFSKDLPNTLVVRTNTETGEVEVLHVDKVIGEDDLAQNEVIARANEFKSIQPDTQAPGELDADSSSSSWYFHFGFGYSPYPRYYYHGYNYNYRPYYNFWYGGYSYTCYRWPWYW